MKGIGTEITDLTPEEKRRFKKWAEHYKIRDVDKKGEVYPDTFYDMQGYWKANQGIPRMAGSGPVHFKNEHFPDTYKQHGHPSFSVESKYSRGAHDGGMWIPGTEVQLKEMKPLPSHVKGVGSYKKKK